MQISPWGWFFNLSHKFMFLSGYCLSLSQKFAQGISQAKLQEDPHGA